MTQKSGFLDGAYKPSALSDVGKLYGDWAATYDAELTENGYASPRRTAAAMSAHVSDRSAPLLDIGCGTGLSGAALKDAGFTTLDGTDFSAEMLALARHKSIYRQIVHGHDGDPLPAKAGQYANMAAIGVFTPGHAPANAINDVLALLPTGGCFGFSLNDHALADGSYNDTIRKLESAGEAKVVFEEYGDHLPGIGLNSTIIVLQK